MSDEKVIDLGPLREVMGNARRVNARDTEETPPPPPPMPRGRDDNLPEDCPIKALGRDADGKTFYYANGLNQLVPLKASDHTHNYFMALCGEHVGYLYQQWPQKKCVKKKDAAGNEHEEWLVTGFNSAQVRDALMQAASLKGVWNPTEKLRGRGAWRDENGNLILHCGSVLVTMVDGELIEEQPGEVGGYVYSAAPPMPRPAKTVQPAGDRDGPGAELRQVLATWNWSRASIDADLMFGWIGAALIGGALEVRPIVWLTGDKATGKTTLQKLLKMLLGDALIATGDTSSAGLYQQVGPASIAIAVDELEADADNKRQMDLVKLARNAFSGSVMFRGGADHKGVQFQARSAFEFSSILIPPLGSQDRSRMAILDLKPLAQGTRPLNLDPAHWRKVGRGILRRLLDQWPRFSRTLDLYSLALAGKGHDTRAAQQLGTLLTCRDMMLFDYEPDSDTLDEWAERFAPSELSEMEDTEVDHVQCLNHLCQSQPDHWRGGSKYSTSELVHQFLHPGQPGLESDAQAALATGGMRVVHKGGEFYLAVANTHEGTRMLFRGSRWEGVAGLPGVWTQALSRVPGAVPGNERIAKRMTRCRLVPIGEILTDEIKVARDQRAADPLQADADQASTAQDYQHTDD